MEMVSVCVSIENDLFNGKKKSPCLIKHHNTKTYDGMKVEHHPFVGSVLHQARGQLRALLYPRETASVILWWMGPTHDMGAAEKIKISVL
jgi:hypothetical protein